MLENIPADMQEALIHHYERPFENQWERLTGGYECDVWRVRADNRDYVVRVCPEWRKAEDIRRIYDYVKIVADYISEVIAPIQTRTGHHFFDYQARGILLFPFVAGNMLDRDNMTLICQSAETLARIHVTSLDLPQNIIDNAQSAPSLTLNREDPKSIQDPALDRWYNDFINRDDLVMGMMHGDYYRGNILYDENYVLGVIDWDECYYGAIIREFAWATWEMCHTDACDNLDMKKVISFLLIYAQTDNRVSRIGFNAIIPLIRYHLRYEIRRSFVLEDNGQDWDNGYREQEIRAFNNLRNLIFTLF